MTCVTGSRALRFGMGCATMLLAMSVIVGPAQAAIDPNENLHVVRDPQAQASLRVELQKPRYRFCNGANYRFWQADKDRLCPHSAELGELCPELANACKRPSWEEEMEPEQEESESDLSWFADALGAIGSAGALLIKGLFFLLIAAAVFLIGRSIAKQIQSMREDEDQGPSHASAPTPEAPALDEFIETRAAILLQQAQRALQEGRLRDALHFSYYATIRSLADQGWVSPHRSKTSGDYLRSLRARAEARDATALIRDLDRARYRHRQDAVETASLTEQVARLIGSLGPLAGVLLAFLCCSCDPPAVPEAPNAPTAPGGRLLFETLLEREASSLSQRYQRVTSIPEETGAIVAVDASLRPLEWKTIQNWLDEGGHLFVANPSKDFEEAFGISLSSKRCLSSVDIPELEVVTLGELATANASATPGFAVGMCADEPIAFRFNHGLGEVTVLGDSSLLDNAHLIAGDNASYAMLLAGHPSGHVEMLGPWTGRGSMTPWQSITRAGFSPWVLHLLALLALFAWAMGRRFGPPKDPRPRSRRSLRDHARALAFHYRRADASGVALSHYAEWAYDQMRQRAAGGRADPKSLTRSVTTSDREAAELRQALTVARRAHELGDSSKHHLRAFRILEATIARLRGRRPGAASSAPTKHS